MALSLCCRHMLSNMFGTSNLNKITVSNHNTYRIVIIAIRVAHFGEYSEVETFRGNIWELTEICKLILIPFKCRCFLHWIYLPYHMIQDGVAVRRLCLVPCVYIYFFALLTVLIIPCVTNSVLLYVSNCYALSWPGRSCK